MYFMILMGRVQSNMAEKMGNEHTPTLYKKLFAYVWFYINEQQDGPHSLFLRLLLTPTKKALGLNA